jgi:uridine kinase
VTSRQSVLNKLADAVLALPAGGIRRVGVDGVDGAGKSVFADELTLVLEQRGARVIRASVDGFHNPRPVRYRLGRDSPEGFFRDSYDYDRMRALLLEPLAPTGNRRFRRATYDVQTESPIDAPGEYADAGAILVVDGIFLHRPELRASWDYSIFLDVDFATSVGRVARRDGTAPEPGAASNRRYVEGQQLYLAECAPRVHASVVIDNRDLDAPRLVD